MSTWDREREREREREGGGRYVWRKLTIHHQMGQCETYKARSGHFTKGSFHTRRHCACYFVIAPIVSSITTNLDNRKKRIRVECGRTLNVNGITSKAQFLFGNLVYESDTSLQQIDTADRKCTYEYNIN